MIALLDASFLIDAKKTDLHNYFSSFFTKIIISPQIEEEVVTKGIIFQKKDAVLVQKQISAGQIVVQNVAPEQIRIIDKVVHKGEASLIVLFGHLGNEDVVFGTDDVVFRRYLKYVFAIQNSVEIHMISTLGFAVKLKERKIMPESQVLEILQELARIGAHPSDAIIEAINQLKMVGDEN